MTSWMRGACDCAARGPWHTASVTQIPGQIAAMKGIAEFSATVNQQLYARRFFVTGRVQGVGYRGFVEHVAGKLGLQGYVRNRRDGRVEVFAMGSPERLGQLRVALERGPMMSDVAKLNEEPDVVDTRYAGIFTIEMTI